MEGERQTVQVRVQLISQPGHDAIADKSAPDRRQVRHPRPEAGDHEHRHRRPDQDRVGAECVQPCPCRRLGTYGKHGIEDDFERPRLEEIRGAVDEHRQQRDRGERPVGTQQRRKARVGRHG